MGWHLWDYCFSSVFCVGCFDVGSYKMETFVMGCSRAGSHSFILINCFT